MRLWIFKTFFLYLQMENIILKDLLKIINLKREEEDQDNLKLKEFQLQLDEESIFEEHCTILQAVGLLAYQNHYVRKLVTEELLKETHSTVHEFCKKNEIETSYGEIIAISKSCKKESEKQKKEIKTKINYRGKEVKMFDVSILKKIMRT